MIERLTLILLMEINTSVRLYFATDVAHICVPPTRRHNNNHMTLFHQLEVAMQSHDHTSLVVLWQTGNEKTAKTTEATSPNVPRKNTEFQFLFLLLPVRQTVALPHKGISLKKASFIF